MIATATRIGRPFGTAREEHVEPVVPAPADVPPVPPSFAQAPEPEEDWSELPSIEGQAQKHPGTVKASGIQTEVFDLSKPEQLNKYNALQATSTIKNPTLVVVKDMPQFSEKTGNWLVFFQYRKLMFRKLAPDKAEKN